MASTLIWLVRFLHILSGVAWVGGAFMWSLVVAPRLLANGPPQIRRPVLEALIGVLPRYFAIVGGGTILWGLVLIGMMFGWSNYLSWLANDYEGRLIGTGFLIALIMIGIGEGVIPPTAKRMLAIMQAQPAPPPGQPPSPPPPTVVAELGALGKRMAMASMATVALGALAVGIMTWAVNTHLCSGC